MKFNDKIKVGSYITAYEKGVHLVIEIIHDANICSSGTLIRYMRVLSEKGIAVKSQGIKACDSSYCTLIDKDFVDAYISKKQEELNTLRTNLLNLVKA